MEAIGRYDQIGVAEGAQILHLASEPQLNAERARPFLKKVEQALARDAGKAMAADSGTRAP